jgi:hypothetical protein
MYSNMDSDGNCLSVLEEALGEKVRRQSFTKNIYAVVFIQKRK